MDQRLGDGEPPPLQDWPTKANIETLLAEAFEEAGEFYLCANHRAKRLTDEILRALRSKQ